MNLEAINTCDYSSKVKIFNNSQATITVFPRVHMFSLDLSLRNQNMKSGSMGFSIYDMPVYIQVSFTTNNTPDKVICEDQNITTKLYNLINKFKSDKIVSRNYEIIVQTPSIFRPHIGLGLTTQILNGTLMCLFALEHENMKINSLLRYNLGQISSCGTHLALNPGLILEFGYKVDNYGKNLHPNLYNVKESIESSIIRFSGSNWKIIIAIPKNIQSLSGKLEDGFWNKNLPDSEQNSLVICYEVLQNLIPSMIQEDFNRFLSSLNTITKTGTKKAEEDIQADQTKYCLKKLRDQFGFAAISSLGPTIYSFSNQAIELPHEDKNYFYRILNLGEKL